MQYGDFNLRLSRKSYFVVMRWYLPYKETSRSTRWGSWWFDEENDDISISVEDGVISTPFVKFSFNSTAIQRLNVYLWTKMLDIRLPLLFEDTKGNWCACLKYSLSLCCCCCYYYLKEGKKLNWETQRKENKGTATKSLESPNDKLKCTCNSGWHLDHEYDPPPFPAGGNMYLPTISWALPHYGRLTDIDNGGHMQESWMNSNKITKVTVNEGESKEN